jgi:N-acetylmuramoyl-L-alanine amidase CwlA
MVHSTGCNQTDANVFIKKWNDPDVDKCTHAIIDKTGVYQMLPFGIKCYGCGVGAKGSYNSSGIQFEICEDNLKSKAYFLDVYLKAVEFCAYLCKKYKINPNNIVCHAEAHKLGYASNHADVMHWFPKHGKSMDSFRADVRAKMVK